MGNLGDFLESEENLSIQAIVKPIVIRISSVICVLGNVSVPTGHTNAKH